MLCFSLLHLQANILYPILYFTCLMLRFLCIYSFERLYDNRQLVVFFRHNQTAVLWGEGTMVDISEFSELSKYSQERTPN